MHKVGYSQQTRLRLKYVVNSVNFLQYERKVTTCNLFFNTMTVYFTKLFLKTYIKQAQKANPEHLLGIFFFSQISILLKQFYILLQIILSNFLFSESYNFKLIYHF